MTAKVPSKGPKETGRDAVGDYKKVLMDVLQQRPSGTRRRLAEVIGKNRSFVSQFSNPGYKTPIPSRHLDTIFEICHFSEHEKARFLEAYRAAHPRWGGGGQGKTGKRRITVDVPDLGSASANHELERLVNEFAASTARLMKGA